MNTEVHTLVTEQEVFAAAYPGPALIGQPEDIQARWRAVADFVNKRFTEELEECDGTE